MLSIEEKLSGTEETYLGGPNIYGSGRIKLDTGLVFFDHLVSS